MNCGAGAFHTRARWGCERRVLLYDEAVRALTAEREVTNPGGTPSPPTESGGAMDAAGSGAVAGVGSGAAGAAGSGPCGLPDTDELCALIEASQLDCGGDVDSDEALLITAAESARRWMRPTEGVAYPMLAIELCLLLALIHLRHSRPIRHAGFGYCVFILLGCMFGAGTTLFDAHPQSGPRCRFRLAFIYLFLTLLLAPRLGKLVSANKMARFYHATSGSAWDKRALWTSCSIVGVQVFMLMIFLLAPTIHSDSPRRLVLCACSPLLHRYPLRASAPAPTRARPRFPQFLRSWVAMER